MIQTYIFRLEGFLYYMSGTFLTPAKGIHQLLVGALASGSPERGRLHQESGAL